jgi:uncharacterized protein YabE (DUF348 family)
MEPNQNQNQGQVAAQERVRPSRQAKLDKKAELQVQRQALQAQLQAIQAQQQYHQQNHN